jgi:hypothetical protein
LCLQKDWEEFHKGSCSLINACFSLAEEQPKPSSNFVPEPLSGEHCVIALVCRLINKVKPENVLRVLEMEAPDPSNPLQYLNPSSTPEPEINLLRALFILSEPEIQINSREMKVFSAVAFQIANSFKVPPEKRDLVAAACLKLMVVAKDNAKFIFGTMVPYETRGLSHYSIPFGLGLYLASSFINNSCEPNMVALSYGSSIVFRAIRPITAGEQLTHSLPNMCVFKPVGRRLEYCKKFYNFRCKCSACNEG